MNWEAIGAVGEIASAAGVIITLIYLATQIRIQNTESKSRNISEISTRNGITSLVIWHRILS
jgi:hypothetical protein